MDEIINSRDCTLSRVNPGTHLVALLLSRLASLFDKIIQLVYMRGELRYNTLLFITLEYTMYLSMKINHYEYSHSIENPILTMQLY